MFVRGYLRASTSEQDASRAKDQLKAFAAERGLKVAAWYVENESGTKLARPELFRLLADSQPFKDTTSLVTFMVMLTLCIDC